MDAATRKEGREEGEEVRAGDREGGIGNRRLEPRARPLVGYRVFKRKLIVCLGPFVKGSFNGHFQISLQKLYLYSVYPMSSG